MIESLKSVPATVMKRTLKSRLAEVENNECKGFLIHRSHKPVAVFLSVQTFEMLRDQINDLLADRLATERQLRKGETKTVSLEAMEARFDCP
ncbi:MULTISPECIES: hypothetical protein [Pseudomonas]|uniref:hypothetical protein n=1 Tax=Pseudomonas TaxID=286 RepID=UPI001E520932|nr:MULTISPECIES: hypothetical protein [Pseudomonas]MCE1118241.1 hypothetical protein [Pseudomonas sp. NMI795_08]